jgi:hypothetical protein
MEAVWRKLSLLLYTSRSSNFRPKKIFFSIVESQNKGPQYAFITTGSGFGKVRLYRSVVSVAQLNVHGPCRPGAQLQSAPCLTNSRVSTTCIGRQHKANNSDPEEPSSSMASALFSAPSVFYNRSRICSRWRYELAT